MFPLRVAKIAPRMRERKLVSPRFTAVVEDKFDEEDKDVKSVRAFMKRRKYSRGAAGRDGGDRGVGAGGN